jgi:hypothetical protein
MDKMKSCNFLKSNFSSQSSIQIILKICLKCLKVTFSLVFFGRLRLKVKILIQILNKEYKSYSLHESHVLDN